MSAPGRPKRELLPRGGTARSAQGVVHRAPGRPKRELLPRGGTARSAEGVVHRAPGRPKREPAMQAMAPGPLGPSAR